MWCVVTRPQAITTMHLPVKAAKVRGKQADLYLRQDPGPTVLNSVPHL